MAAVDVTTLTDQELTDLLKDAHAEQEKRYALNVIPQSVNAMNANYLAATGVTEGTAWKQPVGAHDAYPLNWKVTHNGKDWTSTVMSNVWEPGVANWREETDEEFPDWVQPTGAQDAYPMGAKVSHVDKHWTSAYADNVWVPGEFGWTEVP